MGQEEEPSRDSAAEATRKTQFREEKLESVQEFETGKKVGFPSTLVDDEEKERYRKTGYPTDIPATEEKNVNFSPDAGDDEDKAKYRKTGFPPPAPIDEDDEDEAENPSEGRSTVSRNTAAGGEQEASGTPPAETRRTKFREEKLESVQEFEKHVGFDKDAGDDDEGKKKYRKTGKPEPSPPDDSDEYHVEFDVESSGDEEDKKKYRKTGFERSGDYDVPDDWTRESEMDKNTTRDSTVAEYPAEAVDGATGSKPAATPTDTDAKAPSASEKVQKPGAGVVRKTMQFRDDKIESVQEFESGKKVVGFSPDAGDEEDKTKYRKTGFPSPEEQGAMDEDKKVNFADAGGEDEDKTKYRKTGKPQYTLDEDDEDDSTSEEETELIVRDENGSFSRQSADLDAFLNGSDAPLDSAANIKAHDKKKKKSTVTFPQDGVQDKASKAYRRTALPVPAERDSRASSPDDGATSKRTSGSSLDSIPVLVGDSVGEENNSTLKVDTSTPTQQNMVSFDVAAAGEVDVDSGAYRKTPFAARAKVGFAVSQSEEQVDHEKFRKTPFATPAKVGFSGDAEANEAEDKARYRKTPKVPNAQKGDPTKIADEEPRTPPDTLLPPAVAGASDGVEQTVGTSLLQMINLELAKHDEAQPQEDSYEAYVKARHEANKEYYDADHGRISLVVEDGTPRLGEGTTPRPQPGEPSPASSKETQGRRSAYTPLPEDPKEANAKPYSPDDYPTLPPLDLDFYKKQSYFRDSANAEHEDAYVDRRTVLQELGDHITEMHKQIGSDHVPIKIYFKVKEAAQHWLHKMHAEEALKHKQQASTSSPSDGPTVSSTTTGGVSSGSAVASPASPATSAGAPLVNITGPRSNEAREALLEKVAADRESSPLLAPQQQQPADQEDAELAKRLQQLVGERGDIAKANTVGVPLWAAPVYLPRNPSRSRSLQRAPSSGNWSWPDPRGQSTLLAAMGRDSGRNTSSSLWSWPDPRGNSTLRDAGESFRANWSWPDPRGNSTFREANEWDWPDPRGNSTLREAEQMQQQRERTVRIQEQQRFTTPRKSQLKSSGQAQQATATNAARAATYYLQEEQARRNREELDDEEDRNQTHAPLLSLQNRGRSTLAAIEAAAASGRTGSATSPAVKQAIEDGVLSMLQHEELLKQDLGDHADGLKTDLSASAGDLKRDLLVESGALGASLEKLTEDLQRRIASVRSSRSDSRSRRGQQNGETIYGGGSAVSSQKLKSGRNNEQGIPTVSQILRDAADKVGRGTDFTTESSMSSSSSSDGRTRNENNADADNKQNGQQDTISGTTTAAALGASTAREQAIRKVELMEQRFSSASKEDAARQPSRSGQESSSKGKFLIGVHS